MNNKLLLALSALLISGTATRASAQSFRLDRFRTVEQADDAFGVRRLGDVGHLALGAVLGADYAHDPLVIERRLGNREVQTVVHHELTMQLALSLGLWNRVTAFAGLEVIPLLKGPRVPLGFVPEAGGGGMGDLTLGARVRLLGDADDLFALGLQAALLLPTAGDAAYRGEGTVAGLPQIIAELRPSIVRVNLNAGALLRDRERLAGAPIGSELIWGAAVGVKVLRPLELLGELHGGFGLRDFGARALTQCEFLIGAKAATRAGFTVGAAAGRGFTGGIGSPDLRVIGQLGYRMPERARAHAPETTPPPVPPPPPPPAPVAMDSDGDGRRGRSLPARARGLRGHRGRRRLSGARRPRRGRRARRGGSLPGSARRRGGAGLPRARHAHRGGVGRHRRADPVRHQPGGDPAGELSDAGGGRGGAGETPGHPAAARRGAHR